MSRSFTWNKALTFLSHLLVLSLLFIIPEMVIQAAYDDPDEPMSAVIYGKALIFVSVFYANYYLILPYCINKSYRVARFIGANLALIILAMCGLMLLWAWGHPECNVHHLPVPPPPPEVVNAQGPASNMPPGPRSFGHWAMIWRDMLVILLTIALAVAMKLVVKWHQYETERHEAMNMQQQNELSGLKAQLNPHFLFNTLNTIYALVGQRPDEAREAIHELSTMLRYALYDCQKTVTLSEELNFVRSYLRIASLRMPWPHCIHSVIDAGNCGSLMVAPMLSINLVENAVKHACIQKPDDVIEVNITASNGSVMCFCANPYKPEAEPKKTPGIGLKNLRRRLELLYGDRASLVIEQTPDHYVAVLTVNISAPPKF